MLQIVNLRENGEMVVLYILSVFALVRGIKCHSGAETLSGVSCSLSLVPYE